MSIGVVTKVKVKSSLTNARKFPWDVVYLFPKDKASMLSDAFKFYFRITDTEAVATFLSWIYSDEYKYHGMTRAETTVRTQYENNGYFTADKICDISNYEIVIPLLPRRSGDEVTKKHLFYVFSRKTSKVSAKGVYVRTGYGQGRKYILDKKVTVPDVTLVTNDTLEMSPCTYCTHLSSKLDDPSSCTIGSLKCLTGIIVPEDLQ